MPVSRKPLFVAALVGMAVAVPALAQQPSAYPPACEASKVTKSDVERAHTVFLSGRGFLDESNYDKAISYFKDAYSIDCSVHAILPIIATAYERKGDKAEAIHALGEYLTRVPNAPDREVIERRIRNLRDQLAQEKPQPTATVAPPPTAPTTAPSASATVPPTEPTAGAASTGAGTGEPPPVAGHHTVGPWIVTGVGAAAAITGGVLLAIGTSDVSNASNQCPNRNCTDPSVASQGNTGRSLEMVGGIVGGVGLAAVAAGLVWHFTEGPPAPSSGGATTPARPAQMTPVVTPGYAGLAIGGTF